MLVIVSHVSNSFYYFLFSSFFFTNLILKMLELPPLQELNILLLCKFKIYFTSATADSTVCYLLLVFFVSNPQKKMPFLGLGLASLLLGVNGTPLYGLKYIMFRIDC
jgi:hypothetical protein